MANTIVKPDLESVEAQVFAKLSLGQPLVLITIIKSEGSAPRHAGTHALFSNEGFSGTVGGGILEAKTIELAKSALETATSQLGNFFLANDAASDMICGGKLEVLCEFLTPDAHSAFAKAKLALSSGKAGQWVVKIKKDLNNRVTIDRSFLEVEKGACPQKILLVDNGDLLIYTEPLIPKPLLLLCGGGHVALEVAELAAKCDFSVDVVDDRAEFANKERFPWARKCYVLPAYTNLRAVCGVSHEHYVAIMTRGHKYDSDVLEQVLAGPIKYVGMIGSLRKREEVYAKLKAHGISHDTLAKVYCPIGLSFPTETPQQIAVAVVAELLAAKGQVLQDFRPTVF